MSDAPWPLFERWYADACADEPDVPDAMQVATVDGEGRPVVRTVLMKGYGPDGFVFYTNLQSRKGRHLAGDARTSLVFHWKSLQRQVLAEGVAVPVHDDEADAYWATRHRGSQLSAWASHQSEPLADRATLVAAVAHVTARFGDGPIPRPPHWSGFRVVPHRVEFWQGREDRLHERVVYEREGPGWTRGLRYP